MAAIDQQLRQTTIDAVKAHYQLELPLDSIPINETRKEQNGDYTIVIFPLVKKLKKSPQQIGETLGKFIKEQLDFVTDFELVKGFLNLSLGQSYWINQLSEIAQSKNYGTAPANGKKVVLEYCGPNTNKPLHLGHIRNMFVGSSVANILEASGYKVHKVNILNDRGIAVCRSMLAWQKYGNGETPESTGIKGDHFVGKFYVEFAKRLKVEYAEWQDTDKAIEMWADWMVGKEAAALEKGGMTIAAMKKHFFKSYSNAYFNNESALGKETKAMLLKWEAGDKETRQLWEKMNNWVYAGFQVTYDRLGVSFEEEYKESDYYLKGKGMVEEALEAGKLYKKDDGSIWADLTPQGLDHKLLLRSDGTSVYLTQDLAVAQARYNRYKMDDSIYTVGDEQAYHFQALKAVLSLLEKEYADGIFHLSYGMVDLPSGKMKSREGTVVDADNLIDEVVAKAKEVTTASGKIDDFSTQEAEALFELLGTGAIRFFILQVNPLKRMLFNPEESVKLDGFTAPFIQYSFARIQSVLRKHGKSLDVNIKMEKVEDIEQDLIQKLSNYPAVVAQAGTAYDPSTIAHYVYHLAKSYNKFWASCPILRPDIPANIRHFRLLLSQQVAKVIESGLALLGIGAPKRM